MKTAKEIVIKECERLYNKKGQSAVYSYCDLLIANNKYNAIQVHYEKCVPCEDQTPHLDNMCLVCGTYSN